MASFDLSSILKDVPNLDTDSADEQVQRIPLELIDADDRNFYSLDCIDELAGNIEMFGLMDPIRVRSTENGRYVVVSGHRRREAIKRIAAGGSKQFIDGVPCLVDKAAASAALQELKLIMANSDTRKLSSADQNRQAERLEDLLRQLQDEGVEFPGRLRDWVARLSGMSRSKLARLKVIRDRLDPQLAKAYYAKGTLNEATAYKLAQFPPDVQRQIVFVYTKSRDIRFLYEHTVDELGKDITRMKKLTCPADICHGACENVREMASALYSQGYRAYDKGCGKACCYNCDSIASCKHCCPRMADAKKAARASAAAKRKAEKERQAEADAPKIAQINRQWARFGEACRAASMKYDYVKKTAKLWSGEPAKKERALLAGTCTVTTAATAPPWGSWGSADTFCSVADLLGVSLDYLLCRTDNPEMAADNTGNRQALTWNSGQPEKSGRYLCRIVYPEFDDIRPDASFLMWSAEICAWKGLQSGETVDGWLPLPGEPDNK